MARDIRTVGVIGLGTMGAGIAEVFARHGCSVVGIENDEAASARGRAIIETSTARAVSRGRLTDDDRADLLRRIDFRIGIDALAGAGVDLVVEAVPERRDLKVAVFSHVDQVVDDDTVLATNTSSLSVTEIAMATARPHRVVGLHFFNPAPVQAFVEIVRTVVTDPDVVDGVRDVAAAIGKTPVVVADRAGFIANALLFGYLNHAVAMLESGHATREDIDTAMRVGCGYPMGPLALLDLIGLDTAVEILETMYAQDRDRLHAPAPLLRQLATVGWLGRKSGRGFYSYAAPGSPVVVADAQTPTNSTGNAEAPTASVGAIGVVGCAGHAVALVAALAVGGHRLVCVTPDGDSTDRLTGAIGRALDERVEHGQLTTLERSAAAERVSVSSVYAALADVDLVIDAVVDELSVKTAVLAEVDAVLRFGAVLATTTSSLSVIEVAALTSRPEAVVGLHVVHSGSAARLIEVVGTVASAPEALAAVRSVCNLGGYTTVTCADRAGFIVDALLYPYLNDAVRMLQTNYATADDIDVAMRSGCALPQGPFEVLDDVGLDVALAMQRRLWRESREPGHAPAARLDHLVTAGYLGRSSGRGFRTYQG